MQVNPRLSESVNTTDADVPALLAVAFPVILYLAAESLLNFVDRVLLAHYSIEALEAATVGYAAISIFKVSTIRMGAVTQVFTGQAISFGNLKDAGIYLWQMIWLSLFLMVLFIPAVILTKQVVFGDSLVELEGQKYFLKLGYSAFLFPVLAALSGFFIAQKRMLLVLSVTGLGYLLNFFLDLVLIFGISGIIDPMGVQGAAYARIIGHAFCCILFLAFALSPENRTKLGTNMWRWRMDAFTKCIKIGGGVGLSVAFISLAWLITVKIVALKGEDYLVVVALGDSCAMLWQCFNLGIGKAFMVNAAYVIGSRNQFLIGKLFASSAWIIGAFLLLLSFPLLWFTDAFLAFFFPGFPDVFSEEVVHMLRFSCRFMWFFELVGGVDRVTRSFLTALEDTTYMLVTFAIAILFGWLLPVYLLFYVWSASPTAFWPVMTFGIFARSIPLIYRIISIRKGAFIPIPNV